MNKMIPILSILIVLPLAGLPRASEPVQPATGDLHCLWKATGPEGGVVYLLGSVHVLPEDAYPLPEIINKSFDAASTVVFEVKLPDMEKAGPRLFAKGSLLPGENLYDVISPETKKELMLYLEGAGISPDIFEPMRPWMAALSLTALELVKLGYSSDSGIDVVLGKRAAEAGKEIIGLETVDQQIDLFSNLDERESESFLRYTIRDLKTLTQQLDEVIGAWKTGDVEKLVALLGEAFSTEPEVFKRFVTDRNERWMPQILPLFEEGKTSMVVVGALHLVGKDGVLEKLRSAGYRVEQL